MRNGIQYNIKKKKYADPGPEWSIGSHMVASSKNTATMRERLEREKTFREKKINIE